MSIGIDVDVIMNGITVYSNIAADTFGLTLNVEAPLNASTVEIEVVNQSGGDRTFEPIQFITSVN